jgi:uncharacterized DUF497 family protein
MYDNIVIPLDGIEWESEKARLNIQKHGVSFETAQYIFLDSLRLCGLTGARITNPAKNAGSL